ncbi:glycoside hydrolase family 19 protein [Pseudomonas nicosulfuronedens]
MADTPTPVPTPAPAPLQPLKSWSHPLGDRANPLVQLTNLAEATGGYYPLGRNGFWHGGIHFDPGTDAKTDPSHVRCIADGEVVAYRIDSQYPLSTFYNVSNQAFQAPFATGFVLVRHRLQAPKIEGSEAAPPELTFYSLYLHLQHWAAYQQDDSIARPAFWPQGSAMRVKQTVNDTIAGRPGVRGLNVRCRADHSSANKAPIIDLLPRGTAVTISGEGAFRKLETPRGPSSLMGEDGALQGYLSFQHLAPIEGDLYRVNSSSTLNVRAEPNSDAGTAIIGKLPRGAEVTVSGEGAFRKLESVNQYVHFASLEGQREPQTRDAVVVLATPAGIKAGELIGHIGDNQDLDDAHPLHRLHIEVFSGQDVETFIKNSRNWAKDLPASGKTWLKFAKGTPVIAHQDSFDASHPPSPTATGTPTGTDLLLPKSLLNGLRAEYKIQVAATGSEKARHWYRLEGLFNTAGFTQLDGWVCEEVGVTPWVSPWAWEGYELIYNDSTPREELAYSMSAAHELDEQQQERYLPFIEQAKKGPLHKRLHDLVADGDDGMLTSDELQAGLRFPAVAQLISQLIIHYESEWFGSSQKWDQLDDLMGHSGSTPNPNWVASKERMRKLGWWGEVAASLGLPGSGEVYHFHPLGLVGPFMEKCELIDVGAFLGVYVIQHVQFSLNTPIFTQESERNLREFLENINKYYSGDGYRPNRFELAYMLATARHEMYHFPTGEFFSKKPEVGNYDYFKKYDPVLAATPQKRQNAIDHENTLEGDGFKYRGRGPVHLTWKVNYRKAMEEFGPDFINNPDLAADFENSVPIMIWGMKEGVFTGRKIGDYINSVGVDYEGARKVINGVDQKALIASYASRFEQILKETSIAPVEF